MTARFTFAWVDAHETTFGPEHDREDDKIFGFRVDHSEGNFAALEIDLVNPKLGLLGPGRKVWAWLGWDDGSTAGVVPLFFGKLKGFPDEISAEIVRLTLRARPADFAAQKAALAETLKVAPWWDPVWITPDRQADPDAVLDARTAAWHVDRLTGVVTISDTVSGEAGTADFADRHFYDGLAVAVRQQPVRRIDGRATIRYDQRAVGSVDLRAAIVAAFKASGTTAANAISSFTGAGLAEDWPERGDRIGAGWTVGTSRVARADGKAFPVEYQQVVITSTDASQEPPYTVGDVNAVAHFPLWRLHPTFEADYDAARTRTETVTFTLLADVQDLLLDIDDEDALPLVMTSSAVGEPIDAPTTDDPDGALPVFDPRRKAYFPTDRGRISLEYVLARARKDLLARARAVEISGAVPFEDAIGLSCRMNAVLDDDRLPGGTAAGKIIGYTFGLDGATGKLEASVLIACTLGRGNAVTGATGTPVYVEAGVLEDGIQLHDGRVIEAVAGDVTYDEFDDSGVDDDGVDFFQMTPARVVVGLEVQGGETEQRQVLQAFAQDLSVAVSAVNQVHTRVLLDLVALNTGPFETTFPITVSALMVPMTIDLEAGAST